MRSQDFNLSLAKVNRVKEKQFTLHCKYSDLHAVGEGEGESMLGLIPGGWSPASPPYRGQGNAKNISIE